MELFADYSLSIILLKTHDSLEISLSDEMYVPLERCRRCRYGRIAGWSAGIGHARERLTLLQEIWTVWQCVLFSLSWMLTIFPVHRESDVRGTCSSTSSPRGMYPGLGRIHSYRAAESHCRSAAADKAKAGDWSAVRTSALHCTTQMVTESGAGDTRPREGEPARRSDLSPLYRDRSRISFIRGYREEAIRMACFLSRQWGLFFSLCGLHAPSLRASEREIISFFLSIHNTFLHFSKLVSSLNCSTYMTRIRFSSKFLEFFTSRKSATLYNLPTRAHRNKFHISVRGFHFARLVSRNNENAILASFNCRTQLRGLPMCRSRVAVASCAREIYTH